MSAHVTTADISAALGITGRAVAKRADAQHWPIVGRVCPGGAVYDLTTLPQAIRDAIALARTNTLSHELTAERTAGTAEGAALSIPGRIDDTASREARDRAIKAVAAMPDKSRTRMERKALVVELFNRFYEERGGLPKPARLAFARAWAAGEIDVDAALRQSNPKLSAATISRWQKFVKTEGAERLAGRFGNAKGSGAIDSQPALKVFLIGLLTEHPHAKGEAAMTALRAHFRGKSTHRVDRKTGELTMAPARLPAPRSLARWLARYRREEHAVQAKLANPDGHRSNYLPAFGSRSEGIVRPNQLWETDASPVDIECTDGRCVVIAVIDVHTRRGRLFVSKTSTAVAVGLALRGAILEFGVPETVKSDNGKDFTSQHIITVLFGLSVKRELCDPFQPQQKPHVERFIGTFQHDLIELCPGYIGHSVAERQAIRSRKSFAERHGGAQAVRVNMSQKALQQFCDEWAANVYERRAHDGLAGKSPFEVAAAWTEPLYRIGSVRALDLLLAPMPDTRTRVVGKKGIRVNGFTYGAAELGPMVKETVIPYYDPDGDAGRLVVYSVDPPAFLCIAECPELTGTSRAKIAALMTAEYKRTMSEAVAEARAQGRRFRSLDITRVILDDAIKQADNVVALPKPSIEHSTPALEQAALAAAALDERTPAAPNAATPSDRIGPQERHAAPKPYEFSAALEARQAELERELGGGAPRRLKVPNDPNERYAWYVKLATWKESGVAIPPELADFAATYDGSLEYRFMVGMFKDFAMSVDDYASDLTLAKPTLVERV